MRDLRVNGGRLWDSLMEMATIGATAKGGSCRLALTDEDREGRDLFVQWCRDIGCSIEIDDMGNIFARREGTGKDLKPVCMGSHLDTQPTGGKFDGVYGVLAGLEVLRTLHENNVEHTAPIETVVWTNEEGSRFPPAMVASGVYAGIFTKEHGWACKDALGKTIREELERIGYLGEASCGEHAMAAFLEAHIEQGPILEAENNVIGVVTGGQGQRWYDVTVTGQDSHAGSTPMPGRRDALVAAANMVQAIRSIALDHAPSAVSTVGSMDVLPGSRNTIPGEVRFTIDIRHPDNEVVAAMDKALREQCQQCASNEGVELNIEEIWQRDSANFDERCVGVVRDSAAQLGYPHQDIVSGAGHDACQVCEVLPTAMIFVPCAGGLSHNELESAEPEHLEAGCNVLLHAALKLAE